MFPKFNRCFATTGSLPMPIHLKVVRNITVDLASHLITSNCLLKRCFYPACGHSGVHSVMCVQYNSVQLYCNAVQLNILRVVIKRTTRATSGQTVDTATWTGVAGEGLCLRLNPVFLVSVRAHCASNQPAPELG